MRNTRREDIEKSIKQSLISNGLSDELNVFVEEGALTDDGWLRFCKPECYRIEIYYKEHVWSEYNMINYFNNNSQSTIDRATAAFSKHYPEIPTPYNH